jgi:glucan phosphoethanolaminetransferase (alkaline phosphatase superfamily)
MKTDWITIIFSFQLGFLLNASIWRIIQDKTDDLGYPIGIAIAIMAALFFRVAVNYSHRNA